MKILVKNLNFRPIVTYATGLKLLSTVFPGQTGGRELKKEDLSFTCWISGNPNYLASFMDDPYQETSLQFLPFPMHS